MGEYSDEEYTAFATSIIRSLTGNRWMWPPMRVIDRYPSGTGRLRLTGRPIISIASVKDSTTGDAVAFEKTATAMVLLKDSNGVYYSRGRCGGDVDVDYIYGSRPSGALRRAIDQMAAEMKLSDEGSDECSFPERVQSVTREGVSWTMIDPQDFIIEGRTGLYDVDLAIRAAGGAGARAGIFTAEYPAALRLLVEQQPDPDA